MNIVELKVICDTVVRLTELRQNECKHLSVENFAPELFAKMLDEYVQTSAEKVMFRCCPIYGHSPDSICSRGTKGCAEVHSD